MGEFFARSTDGSLRAFKIKGDTPSVSEQSRIENILSGKPNTPPPPPPEDPGILGRIGRGALRSVDEAQAGVLTTLEAGAHALGSEEYKQYFREKADEQLRQRDTIEMPEDETFGQEVASSAGSSASIMGAGLAGAMAGAPAGAAIGSVGGPIGSGIGALAGAAVGAGAATFPIMMGSNVERQRREKKGEVDYGKAALAATGQAGVEGLTEALGLKVAGVIGRPLTPYLKKVIGEAEQTGRSLLAKRVGKAAVVSAPAGAVEEATQQFLERWQADLPLMDENAQAEYIKSAVIGGILEGGFNATVAVAGGVKDIKDRNALQQAKEDAEAEGAAVVSNYQANQRADAERLKTSLTPLKAGQIEDLRPGTQEAVPSQVPLPEQFTEEEYQSSLEKMKDQKSFAPDKLKLTGMGRPKAQAIFEAMRSRGDAAPTGSENQYLTIKGKPARSYITAPIEEADVKPFRVSFKGREVGDTFKTEGEAQEWAQAAGMETFEVNQSKDAQRYGLYEMHHMGDRVVGKRLMKAFHSSGEAASAARELDPKFSEETNVKNKELHERVSRETLEKQVQQELGPTQTLMQQYADNLVGKGRVKVNVVPRVDGAHLRALGIPEENIPTMGLHEGVTVPDMKGQVRNVISLGTNLLNPNLTEEQRTQEINNVLTHELVHALRNLDILTRKEWDGLYKYALTQKVPGKKYTHMQLAVARQTPGTPNNLVAEEGIAEMMRLFQKDPTAFSKPQRSILQKINDFLKKIIGLSKRHGAEDTMSAIFGGEMATRSEGYGGVGPRGYPGDPLFSSVKVPGFYLKSDQFFMNLKQEKGSVEQWLGILRNSGIKEEERNWLGIEQYIRDVAAAKKEAGEPATLTRGQILDYIRANGLDLAENLKDNEPVHASQEIHDEFNKLDLELGRTRTRLLKQYRDDVNSSYIPFEEWLAGGESGLNHYEAEAYKDLFNRYQQLSDILMPPRPIHPGMIQQGAKIYHELLLHLPGLQPQFNVGAHFHGFKNIIASTRFTSRIFDGKKTLFIEEIQSDLHQQGRRVGYHQPGDEELVEKVFGDLQKVYGENEYLMRKIFEYERLGRENPDLNDMYAKFAAEAIKELEKGKAKEKELEAATNEVENRLNIPDAPFKTTWDELAFKRMVRYAVDNGYDQVAWHGEAQSVADTEKYGTLEERINDKGETEYYKPMPPDVGAEDINVTGIVNFYLRRLRGYASKAFAKFATGPVFVPAQGKDMEVSYAEMFPEFVDFNMALNAMHDTAKGPLAALRRDLARALQIARNQREYDPKAAITKAGLDDTKFRQLYSLTFPEYADVSRVTHDEQGNPNYDKWVMHISPELKAAATEGFPLFSSINTPEFKNWFKDSKIVNKDGTPKVMYHGTRADFDTFDASKRGDMDHGWYGEGFYFTPYHAEARNYTRRNVKIPIPNRSQDVEEGFPLSKDYEPSPWGGTWTADDYTGGNIMPVFLSIQNPYIWTGPSLTNEAAAVNRTQTLKDHGYDGIIRMGNDDFWEVIAFEPSQIKSVNNKGTFDPNDPRITFSSVNIPPKYSTAAPLGQRVPQQPPRDRLAQVEAQITYDNLAPVIYKMSKFMGGKWQHKVGEKFEDGIINMQDRMQPWGKLIDRMRKNGGFISNENDPYLRDVLFSGQTDAMLQEAKKSFYDPLVKEIKNLKVTSADAKEASRLNPAAKSIIDNYTDPKKGLTELYVYALHAQERNAKMRQRNEDVSVDRHEQWEAGSGMHDDEAIGILAWFNSKPFLPKFQKISELTQKVISHTNDVRVQGRLNPDFRKMMKPDGTKVDDYMHYVPLRSWIDEHMDDDVDVLEFARAGKGFNIRGKEDFSALGRRSLGSNIIENAFLQNQEAIIRANKNKVGLSVLQLVKDNPDLMKGIAEIIKRKQRKPVYDRKTGRVKMAPDNSMDNDPMVLKVKDGGEQVYIRFTDSRIARAMGARSGLGNAGTGAILKGMLSFNRYLANINTSYNPEFLVSNMLKDIEDALVNVSEFDLKGAKAEIIKSIYPSLRGVWKGIRTGDMSSEWARTFDEFKKMGGMTAFMGIHQLSDNIDHMNRNLKADLSGAPAKVKKALLSVRNFVEDSNSTIENGTRLATYKVLRDKFLEMGDRNDPKFVTRAKENAARISKGLTINFNMGGEMKPFWNAMYLFYNAGIQGSMAVLNPFIRSRKMKAIWGGIFTAGILQDFLMGMFSEDDDDGKKVYDKIEDWKLEHNMIYMDPFGITERGYFQIPTPYLLGAIYNAGRATSRGVRGSYTPAEAANSVFGVLAASLNPYGGANSFLNFVMPTVIDPLVDLSQNENYMGQNIAPPQNPFTATPEKRSQLYWNNTSPIWKNIADFASWASGSDGDYLPGKVEVSPNQVEYVFDWATGGAGTFFTRVTDLFTKEQLDAKDIPFARRVYGNVTTKNDTAEYFEHRNDVLPVLAELKAASKAGDSEQYQRIMGKYPEEYKLAVQMNKIENARKKYSAKIKKIRETKKIPEEKKKEMIDSIKAKQDELVGKANALFN